MLREMTIFFRPNVREVSKHQKGVCEDPCPTYNKKPKGIFRFLVFGFWLGFSMMIVMVMRSLPPKTHRVETRPRREVNEGVKGGRDIYSAACFFFWWGKGRVNGTRKLFHHEDSYLG